MINLIEKIGSAIMSTHMYIGTLLRSKMADYEDLRATQVWYSTAALTLFILGTLAATTYVQVRKGKMFGYYPLIVFISQPAHL